MNLKFLVVLLVTFVRSRFDYSSAGILTLWLYPRATAGYLALALTKAMDGPD